MSPFALEDLLGIYKEVAFGLVSATEPLSLPCYEHFAVSEMVF
jgi:hypothetical protein